MSARPHEEAGIAVELDPLAVEIDHAAAEIRHITRVGTLRMALDVGEVVFHRIFAGNAEAVRKKGPKHASLCLLAQRDDVGISRASLWRCVAVYELSLRLPLLERSKHLGVSHVRAVLGLSVRQQERVLNAAEREQWSVADVASAVAASRKGGGGRPPKSETLRVIDALMRIASIPERVFKDHAAASKLKPEDVEVALEMINELDLRLGALRELLGRERTAQADAPQSER